MSATTTTPTIERGGRMIRLDAAQAALDETAANLAASVRRIDGDEAEKVRVQAAAIAEACGNDLTGQPRYTVEDVLGWIARAVELGAGIPVFGPRTVERVFRLELVPNAILRERFQAQCPDRPLAITEASHMGAEVHQGMTAGGLAKALGFTRTINGTPLGDGTAVERLLGLRTTSGRPGHAPTLRLFIPYDLAVRIADVLDVNYHDLGV